MIIFRRLNAARQANLCALRFFDILGATGFIGSAVAARLVADGHAVSGLGRTPVRARIKWPDVRWLRADLAHMTRAADWQETLKDQHMVVNCAGALQDGFSDDLAA